MRNLLDFETLFRRGALAVKLRTSNVIVSIYKASGMVSQFALNLQTSSHFFTVRICIGFLGVERGLEMILRYTGLSGFEMNPCRTIWTHVAPYSMIFIDFNPENHIAALQFLVPISSATSRKRFLWACTNSKHPCNSYVLVQVFWTWLPGLFNMPSGLPICSERLTGMLKAVFSAKQINFLIFRSLERLRGVLSF